MTDPFSALLAAIPGLAKAGADIASASDEAKRNAQLIEFQKALINANALIASVQQQNSSLLREKDDLEQQIVRMKNWEREKERYSLVTIWEGAVAYAPKQGMSAGQPPHWLCTSCYENGKKSILNPFVGTNKLVGVSCPTCKAKLECQWFGGMSAPEYAPE